jgi:hypothetical protein
VTYLPEAPWGVPSPGHAYSKALSTPWYLHSRFHRFAATSTRLLPTPLRLFYCFHNPFTPTSVDLSLPHTLHCHNQVALTSVLSHIYPQTASKASPKCLTNPIFPSFRTLLQTVLGEQTPLGPASLHFPSQLADLWVLSAWHKSPRLLSATAMPLALYSNKLFFS